MARPIGSKLMTRHIPPCSSWVVVRMTDNPLSNATPGAIKIWRNYDDGYAWGTVWAGSWNYDILGYADSYAEAKAIRQSSKGSK